MGQGRGRNCLRYRLGIKAIGSPAASITFIHSAGGQKHPVLTIAPRQSNTTLLSHINCPGGGQVWVEVSTPLMKPHAADLRDDHH